MKPQFLKGVFASAVVAASLMLVPSASKAAYVGPFYLSLDVTGAVYDYTNILIFTSNPPASTGSTAGQFSIPAGDSTFNDPFQLPGAAADTSVFLLGLYNADSTPGLALFAKDNYTGEDFATLFGAGIEAGLISDLLNNTDNYVSDFKDANIASIGFMPGDSGYITTFSVAADSGTFNSSFSPVPLPAAFPLFASGLGAVVLLAYRRQRKTSARAAAA